MSSCTSRSLRLVSTNAAVKADDANILSICTQLYALSVRLEIAQQRVSLSEISFCIEKFEELFPDSVGAVSFVQ